jgi:hypothetical protein
MRSPFSLFRRDRESFAQSLSKLGTGRGRSQAEAKAEMVHKLAPAVAGHGRTRRASPAKKRRRKMVQASRRVNR